MSGHDQREDYDDEPGRKRRPPDESIRWAASTIWAFGLIQLILSVASLLFTVGVSIVAAIDEEFGEDVIPLEVLLAAAASVVAIAWNAIVICAANSMKRFRRYPLAVLGSAMFLLPLPFIYFLPFALPLGVYALILLSRSDARARFEAVARGTVNQSRPTPG